MYVRSVSSLTCVGLGGCDECGEFETLLYRDRGDVSLLPDAYCLQCIRPDDMATCEECERVVPFADPVFPWDDNSMRVCGPCGVRVRSERPEGDE